MMTEDHPKLVSDTKHRPRGLTKGQAGDRKSNTRSKEQRSAVKLLIETLELVKT